MSSTWSLWPATGPMLSTWKVRGPIWTKNPPGGTAGGPTASPGTARTLTVALSWAACAATCVRNGSPSFGSARRLSVLTTGRTSTRIASPHAPGAEAMTCRVSGAAGAFTWTRSRPARSGCASGLFNVILPVRAS